MRQKFHNEFDDLIIRSNYLSKVSGNDHSKELVKFKHNIKITSRMMYDKYIVPFSKAGYNYDDILQMSNLYAYYYFDLYSKQELIDNDSQNRSGLINFIRQRMKYLSDMCNKKSRNYLIGQDFVKFYAKTDKSVDVPDDVLASDYKKHGYRKISKKELKEIKLNSKTSKKLVDSNGFEVRKVELFHNDMLDSYTYSAMCCYENEHTISPEEVLINRSDRNQYEKKIEEFEDNTDELKLKKIRKHISINTNQHKDTKKVEILRKYAKQLKERIGERPVESIQSP